MNLVRSLRSRKDLFGKSPICHPRRSKYLQLFTRNEINNFLINILSFSSNWKDVCMGAKCFACVWRRLGKWKFSRRVQLKCHSTRWQVLGNFSFQPWKTSKCDKNCLLKIINYSWLPSCWLKIKVCNETVPYDFVWCITSKCGKHSG